MSLHRARGLPWALSASVLCLVLGTLGRSDACGGTYSAIFPVLQTAVTNAGRLIDRDDPFDFENWPRPELRFLYPAVRTHGDALGELWEFSYDESFDEKESPRAYERTAREWNQLRLEFGRVLSLGDWKSGVELSRTIVEKYLGQPPSATDPLVWNAVELLELAPHLKGATAAEIGTYFGAHQGPVPAFHTKALGCAARLSWGTVSAFREPPENSEPRYCSYRAPSIELFRLLRRTEEGIPNGWSNRDGITADEDIIQELLDEADGWVSRYPNHPLVDWVRLWKVRLNYFGGRNDDNWRLLVALYPRYRVRTLAEMRYLIYHGRLPNSELVDNFPYPELLTGMVGLGLTVTGERWNRFWMLAEKNLKQPWALNLQERLLIQLTFGDQNAPLPAAFPKRAENRSQLWGSVRAAALASRGKTQEAEAQLRVMPPDEYRTAMLAGIWLKQGKPLEAAQLPKLDGESQAYVVRVRLSDAELSALIASGEGPVALAAVERATRLMEVGKYAEAGRSLQKLEPERAKLYAEADRLARSRQPLVFARWLREHGLALTHPLDSDLYRGMSEFYLGGGPDKTALGAAIRRGDGRWVALGEYVTWLEQNPKDPSARQVLSEADGLYNALITFGYHASFFADYAKTSTLVRRLREVGAKVRAAARKVAPG